MSLIDEALKRARHEAARQEAVKRDAARHDGPRPIPKLYAERQASRAPLWAGIATGAAVALLGVIAWLLWGRAPVAPPVAVAATEAPMAVSAAPASEPAAPAPAPSLSATAAPPAAPVRLPVAEPAPRPSVAAVPVPQQPVPEPRVSRQPTAPVSPVAPPLVRDRPPNPAEPPAVASSTGTGATQTFVREANLPGGGPRFRLGGIAYSEEAPIALINGAALGKGEVVEGYVVRRIDAAEVELEGPGGRVVLRLK